ncbi:MAG: hypothetical protein KC933_03965 [Myxococcales bacterium]|nr:hypothetical protein [Myxococcales bacterium]
MFFLATAATFLTGCPDEGSGLGPGTHPDGGAGSDAGVPDADSPYAVLRFGRYTQGPTRAVLTSPSLVLLGHELAYIEPELYGQVGEEAASPWRGGLITLDPATGATRLYTEADGLPAADVEGPGRGPVSIYDLDWIEEGQSFVAAGWTHLIRGEWSAEGDLHFTAVQLTAPGATTPALISTVVALASEIVVGTDQGFVAVNRDDLAVRRWIATDGLPWTRALVRLDADTALATAGPVGTPEATDALVIEAAAVAASPIAGPGPSYVPVSAAAVGGAAVLSYRLPEGRGGLWQVEGDGAGGFVARSYVEADVLAGASAAPFVVNAMAYDPVHHQLVLGGAISVAAPVRTGGLAVIELDPDGHLPDPVRVAPLMDRRDPYAQVLPWQVGLLEVDAVGRWYVAGVFLCNEHRAGLTGLYRIEQGDDGPRLVRPIPTGVRAITAGPDGAWWLSLRDESPGLRCFGQEVQQGVCRLRADGACELYTPNPNTDDAILANASARRIAFGADPADRKMAFATDHEATYVRVGDVAEVLSTQFEPGLNLDATSIAWGEGNALWIGSTFGWDSLPGFPEDQVILVNRRIPQGLGYMEIDPTNGRTSNLRRFVRAASDQVGGHEEIDGLSSSNVQALLPLTGGAVLVGLGPERVSGPLDHFWPELAPTNAPGGIAWVRGRSVVTLESEGRAPLTEVVAFARMGEAVLALDAALGVFEVDVEAKTATQVVEAPWSQDERGLSLAVSPQGVLAVGTTRGLYLQGGDGALAPVEVKGRTGFVSAVRFEADGVLLAGGDEGLLRLVAAGATPPALGPTGPLPREPWPLSLGCNGEVGCVCGGPDDCAPGLGCACSDLSDCLCAAPLDPCDRDPGSAGCACRPEAQDCARNLVCTCVDEDCACQPESVDCTQDCTCGTASGCPEAMHCEGGIAGFSCVPD